IGVAAALCLVLLVTARARGWFEPSVPGGQATVRLISTAQYINALHDLFGQDIVVDMSLPPVHRRPGLWALGAASAVITPCALEQFELIARKVALQVVDETHRPVLVPCTPSSQNQADPACARMFFARVGRYLYRRPLTAEELQAQVAE